MVLQVHGHGDSECVCLLDGVRLVVTLRTGCTPTSEDRRGEDRETAVVVHRQDLSLPQLFGLLSGRRWDE